MSHSRGRECPPCAHSRASTQGPADAVRHLVRFSRLWPGSRAPSLLFACSSRLPSPTPASLPLPVPTAAGHTEELPAGGAFCPLPPDTERASPVFVSLSHCAGAVLPVPPPPPFPPRLSSAFTQRAAPRPAPGSAARPPGPPSLTGCGRVFLRKQVPVPSLPAGVHEAGKPVEKADAIFSQERDPRFAEMFAGIGACEWPDGAGALRAGFQPPWGPRETAPWGQGLGVSEGGIRASPVPSGPAASFPVTRGLWHLAFKAGNFGRNEHCRSTGHSSFCT